MTLHRVAMVWWNAEDLERAEAPWREALAINRASVGPMHPETGRRSLARQSAEEALAIGSETLVEDHARMREVMELIEVIDRSPED